MDYKQCYINARNTSTDSLSHVDNAYNGGRAYASNARNTSNVSHVDNAYNVGGTYASSASYIERSLVQVTVTDFLQQKMA